MEQRLGIEGVFGSADERSLETIEPRSPRGKVPYWPLVPLLVELGLAAFAGDNALFVAFERITFWMAVLSTCLFAGRLEDELYRRNRRAAYARRLMMSAGLGAVAVLVATNIMTIADDLGSYAAERAGWLIFAGALWTASAAGGTILLFLIDVLSSTLAKDFRRRIVIAVLSLISLAFGLCSFVAVYVANWLAANATKAGVALPTLFGIKLSQIPFVQESKMDTRMVLPATVIGAAIVALPAVISVCAKLADNVMERITMLQTAFERVAEGDRNVHVDEGGTPEFFSLSLSFNEMIDKLYLAERIERAFGQYVSAQVLERIRQQQGSVKIAAQLKVATVFFADIRGFTPISERLAPEVVVDLLNRYLEQVVPIVEQHQGFINKFVGDAVVVVFNGPLEQLDHAERATRCAIAVQKLIAQANAHGLFPEVGQLNIGIGVATGPMLCGNIGTKSRMEYTVIGDTVNLSSRMTGHARPGEVWVSEETAKRLPQNLPAFPAEAIKFKGKDRSVIPYRAWPAQPIDPNEKMRV
ncbi:MAG: HAMP domain-containing protein [Deltaproteobacteria bacterium]|nr:HAMP domain-containing protein [Deltaproteobacteria bacterium]